MGLVRKFWAWDSKGRKKAKKKMAAASQIPLNSLFILPDPPFQVNWLTLYFSFSDVKHTQPLEG